MKKHYFYSVLVTAALAFTACSSLPKLPADLQAGVDANNPEAFYKAGQYYDNLKHVSDKKKWAKSAELYRKGAELGDARCQFLLGFAYEEGAGVPRDYGQARTWYTKAAEQTQVGLLYYCLGRLYDEGLGGPINYAVAKDYYERSSALGCAVAVNNLAIMYEEGHGVKVDKSKALKLYEQAASMGISVAKDNAANLRREMAMQSPASIKGKTFSFSAPYSLGYRKDGSTFRDDAYTSHTIVWKWGNKSEKKDLPYSYDLYEYKKTGARTAELIDVHSMSDGMARPDSWGLCFTLHFETPTSGTCDLEVTGRYGTIGADKYTAKGRFTLK